MEKEVALFQSEMALISTGFRSPINVKMLSNRAAMENDLSRAQHYRHLAELVRKTAREKAAAKRQRDFLDLASQYERLAGKLVGRQIPAS